MTTALPATGKFSISEGKTARVHTFISPDATFNVTSSIIEFKDRLFIVDGQLVIPYAKAVFEYANTLKKPIARVYLTHAHPDHFLGLDVFDAPIYALAGVKARLESIGEWMRGIMAGQFAPGMVPDKIAVISELVAPGTETVAGAKIDFLEIKNGETESALAIGIPDEGILIAQDLVYNKEHAFVGERNFQGWKHDLEDLKKLTYRTIIPGHGLPAGPELFDAVIAYLSFAETAVPEATSADDLKAKLTKQYPRYGAAGLIDEENLYLFPAKQ